LYVSTLYIESKKRKTERDKKMENQKSCPYYTKGKNKPCIHYQGRGKCQDKYYYCIEYFKRKSPLLSFSSIKDFERCPFRFYLTQIQGLQLKEEYLPVQLKMGKLLHLLIRNEDEGIVKFSYDETIYESITWQVYSKIREYELIPDGIEREVKVEKRNLHGVIDLLGNNYFGEVKFTQRPDFYLHSFTAQNQLEFYFYLTECTHAYILPIRMPCQRQGKEESEELFVNRVVRDIKRRISYYFPHYKKEKKPFKWGLKFYRAEVDLNHFQKRLEWTTKEIQKCCQAHYFPQRKSNCLFPSECEYLSICKTGEVNQEVYERRKL
jgi:hypothetical protein